MPMICNITREGKPLRTVELNQNDDNMKLLAELHSAISEGDDVMIACMSVDI